MEITTVQARGMTDRISNLLENITRDTNELVRLVKKAKESGAWKVLGYKSWPEYVTKEFSRYHIIFDRDKRIRFENALSELGMSTRAIATLSGVSKDTVNRDMNKSTVSDETVTQSDDQSRSVEGLDGRTYKVDNSPEAKEAREKLKKRERKDFNKIAPDNMKDADIANKLSVLWERPMIFMKDIQKLDPPLSDNGKRLALEQIDLALSKILILKSYLEGTRNIDEELQRLLETE